MVTMEHRYHPRKPIQLDVHIREGDRVLGWFRTRDVGMEGAFVETGPVDVGPYDVLTLTFCTGRRSSDAHEVMGLVVHCSEEGVGLMYAAEDPRFHLALRSILHAAA